MTTAGTAEALGTGQILGKLMVKALPANTGWIYVGNDGAGDVSSANGMVLDANDVIVFEYVHDLAGVYVDSSVNGEGVSWLRLNV